MGSKYYKAYQFVKPFAETGAKKVADWMKKAATAKKEAAKFNLKQTFKETDKKLKKLKKTVKKIKHYYAPKDF